MRIIKLLLSISLSVLLSSCSYVTSYYPIGIEHFPTTPDEWNGTWRNEDGIVKIQVSDESKGIIELAWIAPDHEGLKFESMTCQIMKGKKWLYVNVLEIPNEKTDGYYYWGRIKKEKKKIIIWPPAVEPFQIAAEEKKLRATVEITESTKIKMNITEGVKLLDKPETIINLVENNRSKYFEWENPVVLLKSLD